MPYSGFRIFVRAVPAIVLAACSSTRGGSAVSSTEGSTAGSSASGVIAIPNQSLPPDADHARERLNSSPRHGEWVMISVSPPDSIRAWVVYPERKTKAPVVVVIHEIFGLSTWIRAVADQLAADGFIAIAPDFLTSKLLPGTPDSVPMQEAMAAIRTLDPAQIQHEIDATARYGMSLPAAQSRYGVVGFCWGGGISFEHATHAPSLGASVVYYGTSPRTETLSNVRAPVLGLYGGSDARVDATIPAADSALRATGKIYSHSIFDGAGHGFLRQQTGMNGANMRATQQAWPATIAWFRHYLDR
jgi:carboxymethylenebutenolidase